MRTNRDRTSTEAVALLQAYGPAAGNLTFALPSPSGYGTVIRRGQWQRGYGEDAPATSSGKVSGDEIAKTAQTVIEIIPGLITLFKKQPATTAPPVYVQSGSSGSSMVVPAILGIGGLAVVGGILYFMLKD
jgi:hypothetical protein